MARLISLEIVDFKNLQVGTIEWNPDEPGFSIISVRDFYQRSTLFEAFQFAFGHDTDAEVAEVIVTLRDSGGNMIRFKHSKNVEMDEVTTTYEAQVIGIDNEFTACEQKEYFDKLAQLNVFALNGIFLFGGGAKNILATNNLDLRSFLEMHLLHKDRCDDYEDVNLNIEQCARHVAQLKETANIIKKTQDSYQSLTEERKQQKQAEQDFCFWKLYAHSEEKMGLEKNVENISGYVDDGDGDFQRRLDIIEEIENWEFKVIENNLLEHINNSIEVNKQSWATIAQQCGQSIQREIEMNKGDILVLTKANFKPFFRNNKYSQFKHRELDLIIKLKDLQFSLMTTELGDETLLKDDVFKKMKMCVSSDTSAFHLSSVEGEEIMKCMRKLQNEVFEKLQLATFADAESYNFEMNNIDPVDDNFKSFLNQLPNDGMTKIHTKTQWKIRPEDIGNRIVLQVDNSHVVPTAYCPFGHIVRSDEKPSMYDSTQLNTSLQSTLCDVEKKINGNTYIVNKMKQAKKHSIVRSVARKEAAATSNQDVLNLQAQLYENEKKFVRRFLSEFKDVMSELRFDQFHAETTKSIMMAWNCFERHQDVLTTNVHANIQGRIVSLKEDLRELVGEYQIHKSECSHLKIEQESLVNAIRDEATDISKIAIAFLKNTYAKADKSTCETFIAGKECVISHLKDEVKEKNWETPESFDAEILPDNFYNCISLDNAEKVYKFTYANPKSFAETYKVLESHLHSTADLFKENFVYYDDENFKNIQRENNKKKKAAQVEMIAERNSFQKRCVEFEQKIEDFDKHYIDIAEKCSSIGIALNPKEFSLKSPIRQLVDDQVNNPGCVDMMMSTYNHHNAALILKLAMNLTVESPILIFDSLDYIIEPQLISPFIDYLQEKVKAGAIQVIFMLLNPQEGLSIPNAYQMWIDKKDVEQIANTSDLLKVGVGEQQSDHLQSEMGVPALGISSIERIDGAATTSTLLPRGRVITSTPLPK
ncbi:uncharacterized protein LOC116337606 [Contarinia nasturtii]|uniref:uncharacterized protein LOC116337606 n=1 Tax=Contarinia nasturtii TaxID=265458 RepID=UPI0012D3C39F|nr:uncharacterized protein LOC116337606 [Contarinia nasturtii]